MRFPYSPHTALRTPRVFWLVLILAFVSAGLFAAQQTQARRAFWRSAANKPEQQPAHQALASRSVAPSATTVASARASLPLVPSAAFNTAGSAPNASPTAAALSYDGSDDLVTVPYDAAFATNTYSFSLWVRPQSTGDYGAPLSNRNNPSASNLSGFNLYLSPSDTWELW